MQLSMLNHASKRCWPAAWREAPRFQRPSTLYSPFKALFVVIILLSMYAGTSTAVFAQGPACGGSDIGGIVYRDYNGNSLLDAREPGLAGVTVTAYASDNSKLMSATTSASGAYLLPGITVPVRVEFTGLPSYVQEGPFGANSGTTVQFLNGPTCTANLGVNNPAQYCQSNPFLATSCYAHASATSGTANVLDSFPYNAGAKDILPLPPVTDFSTPAPNHLALESQIGATWGQAWRSSTSTLYLAAFMKRHVRFGPGGPAAIYKVGLDPATGLVAATPTLFVDLSTIFPGSAPVAGADVHDFSTINLDTPAFDAVGKSSLGDLDITDDGNMLFVVNLYDRRIYAIPIDNPAGTRRFAAPAPSLLDCPATDARPFALKARDGLVYAGVTCTGETSATNDPAKLGLFVYAFDPNAIPAGPGDVTAPTYTEVLRFSGAGTNGMAYPHAGKTWNVWTNNFNLAAACTPSCTNPVRYPMPWLTDIEFDNSDMILGVRDRFGDMTGHGTRNPSNLSDSTLYEARARGDILRACSASNTQWIMESNSQSNAGCLTQFGPTAGNYTTSQPNSLEGPGGGEFFHGDDMYKNDHTKEQPEHTMGGLVQVPGFPDVVVDNYDPYGDISSRNTGGISWLNNLNGDATRNYVVFASSTVGAFGKANGLGDLEALCLAAPLELGNRVWCDGNHDGVQEAGEAGVGAVTLVLQCGADAPVSKVTDANGNFIFTDADYVTVAGKKIPRDSQCTITIDTTNPANNAALTNTCHGVTTTTPPVKPFNDGYDPVRDSNCTSAGNLAQMTVNTGSDGANNHSFDCGFTSAAPAPVRVGDFVWYDNNQNGQQDNGELGVPGVMVTLYDATTNQPVLINGNPLTQITDSNGHYLFDNRPSGNYYVIFNLQTLPAGYGVTILNAAGVTEAANSDANPTTGQTRNTGVLAPGAQDLDLDMGIFAPLPEVVKVGDFVWVDSNHNGQQDAGEPGVPNVGVTLCDGATGQPMLVNGNPVKTTTDSTGHYLFGTLPPGNYCVIFDLTTLPAGYTATIQNATGVGEAANSDANPTTGQTRSTGALAGGAQDLDLDLGIFAPVKVGDFVWIDTNHNGQQDVGEPGVPNVSVTLCDGTTGQPMLVNGSPVKTTTDSAGHYLFANLLSGNYCVIFDLTTLPPGYQVTTQTAPGVGEGSNSDANPTTGQTRNTGVLPIGGQDLDLDLGIFPTPQAGCEQDLKLNLDMGLLTGQSEKVTFNATVPFVMNVVNVGTIAAKNIIVANTIPAGLTLNDPSWIGSSNVVTRVLAGPLAPGASVDVQIILRVTTSSAETLTNTARINSFQSVNGQLCPGSSAATTKITTVLPDSLELGSFTGVVQQKVVLLRWTTLLETNTAGFHLYRRIVGSNDKPVRVNPALILTKGAQGSDYAYLDQTVSPGAAYTYWLVKEAPDGSTEAYGSVIVDMQVVNARIYIPFVMH